MAPTRENALEREIDLLEIIKNIRQGIALNRALFFGIVFLGLLIGGIAFYITPTQYKLRMIAQSRFLKVKEVIEIIEDWNDLLRRGERGVLQTKLHLSKDAVNHLLRLSGSAVDDVTGGSGFIIEATFYSTLYVDSLQKGILQGFKENAYSQRHVVSHKQRLSNYKRALEQEILHLDSLNRLIISHINQTSGRYSEVIVDPGSISQTRVKLYEEKFKAEEELNFVEDLQLITGFELAGASIFPNFYVFISAGLVLGIFIAIVVVLLIKK